MASAKTVVRRARAVTNLIAGVRLRATQPVVACRALGLEGIGGTCLAHAVALLHLIAGLLRDERTADRGRGRHAIRRAHGVGAAAELGDVARRGIVRRRTAGVRRRLEQIWRTVGTRARTVLGHVAVASDFLTTCERCGLEGVGGAAIGSPGAVLSDVTETTGLDVVTNDTCRLLRVDGRAVVAASAADLLNVARPLERPAR
jgi:hypothetical protein